MHLLEFDSANQLRSTEFTENIPQYAILSHTWGPDEDEVTFGDLKSRSGTTKPGYAKIQFCGEQARKDSLRYFWVDTCCIDKTDLVALQEAIRSMFRWYRDAVKCYAYLSDVSLSDADDGGAKQSWELAFRNSKWFTRGWTLQELIGPTSVEFFSWKREYLGSKTTLEQQIHEITGIPIAALRGSPLSQFSSDEKMRWAAKRRTKKPEDKAYCLQGIFDVYMPLMYGEGEHAMIRLRAKIDKRLGRKQAGILQWLSPLDPSSQHLENQKRRLEGTGQWMLENDKFVEWSSETSNKRSSLCCYGDAGAGKTIISSLVIDELEHRVATSGTRIGIAYVYFDYRDQERQTVENVLGSILKQLLSFLPELPEDVSELYEEQVAQPKALSSTNALKLLRTACAQFSKVYVCLDALDEAGNLRGFLEQLYKGPRSMQIFMTGRQHVQGIVQEYFKEDCHIFIEAHENDIRLFIEHEVGRANKDEPDAMDPELKEDILSKVIESANGSFLLPTLQIRAVLQATSIRDRSEALKTLPSNLDEAFVGTIRRIERQPIPLRKQAGWIIAWVLLAERPLFVDELLCSLAIRDKDTALDLRGVPGRKSLLNCCQGLVLIDQETSTVRLVHYSLQEYLNRQENIFGRSKAAWHCQIARTCLTFLNFLPAKPENTAEADSGAVSILPYAAVQWGHHLRKSGDSSDAPLDLAKEYLDGDFAKISKSLELLYQVLYQGIVDDPDPGVVFPAQITAFFGIPVLMSDLISTGKVDLDSRDRKDMTPLSWAAREGHEAVVRILLERGADFTILDYRCWAPLQHAAGRHEAVFRLLLSLESNSKRYNDAKLLTVAEYGLEDLVSRLLKNGANIEHTAGDYIAAGKPLSFAARNGHKAVVELLLRMGAEIDGKDSFHCTPLSYAAGYGHKAVVELLLQMGAEIDTKNLFHCTPLSYAAGNGHKAVVELLLQMGAKIDEDDRTGRTPLSHAAGNGHKAVVELLLQMGAKIDVKDRNLCTPLSYAAKNGHESVVKILLERGADKYWRNGDGDTPLCLAERNSHRSVELLLKSYRRESSSVSGMGSQATDYRSKRRKILP